MVQCHLVKGPGKIFYKLPKLRLAGNFQMCSLNKPEQAVWNRWCLSPVLKCSVGTLRALCTIACDALAKAAGACFVLVC